MKLEMSCTVAIGGVLSQMQDGRERMLAYWSWQLQKVEKNYSTIEHEALAVVGAFKEFFPYLYGFPFKLLTDHNLQTFLKGIKDTGVASLAGCYFCSSLILWLSTRKEQVIPTLMPYQKHPQILHYQ